MKHDIIQQLTRQKIHIATVQETHIPHSRPFKHQNYKIITTGALRTGTCKHTGKGLHHGGVATLIHQALEPYISTIKRIDPRIMTATLQHEDSITPITILITYAAQKGYTSRERKQHWGQVGNTIRRIEKSHIPIWSTDSNGQLGSNNQDGKNKHIIGPYTYSKETEKGNGQRLYRTCKNT